MSSIEPPSNAEEQESPRRFWRSKWSIPELFTLAAFVVTGGLVALSPSDFALGYMGLAFISVFAYGFGVRWAIVKMIPISWVPIISWVAISSIIGELTNQPNLIDSDRGNFVVICLTFVVPAVAVLPFAKPFRERLSVVFDALGGSRFGRALSTVIQVIAAFFAGATAFLEAVSESVGGCLANLFGLIVLIWLIKTIWYAL
jgi:hypothetical protein